MKKEIKDELEAFRREFTSTGKNLRGVYSIRNLREFSGIINPWIFMEFN